MTTQQTTQQTTIYTKSQVRAAILRAADHIERNPGLYVYNRFHLPGEGGILQPPSDQACMWGWIGYFIGMKGKTCSTIAKEICGAEPGHLYDLCTPGYTKDAALAVAGMRKYAATHFAPDEGPLVHTDLVPLADYHEFLRAVRAGELVSDVESGVGA